MDWLKTAEDARNIVGAFFTGAGAIGALIMKIRQNRRSELETLVNELQEECGRKGIENERLNKLVSRLDKVNKHQRLEIFLHNRVKNDAKAELLLAIEKVRSNAGDCLTYISRAVSKLEEDVVVPVGEEDES